MWVEVQSSKGHVISVFPPSRRNVSLLQWMLFQGFGHGYSMAYRGWQGFYPHKLQSRQFFQCVHNISDAMCSLQLRSQYDLHPFNIYSQRLPHCRVGFSFTKGSGKTCSGGLKICTALEGVQRGRCFHSQAPVKGFSKPLKSTNTQTADEITRISQESHPCQWLALLAVIPYIRGQT